MMTSRLLPLLALALTVACGGNEGGRSPAGPTPVAPPPPPLQQTLSGTVSVFGTTRHPLSVGRAGTLTVRLTWTNAAVDLDLYLAPSSCLNLYPTAACGILAASDAARGVTSELITRTVSANETFNLFVDNLSTNTPQSYTIDLRVQ